MCLFYFYDFDRVKLALRKSSPEYSILPIIYHLSNSHKKTVTITASSPVLTQAGRPVCRRCSRDQPSRQSVGRRNSLTPRTSLPSVMADLRK